MYDKDKLEDILYRKYPWIVIHTEPVCEIDELDLLLLYSFSNQLINFKDVLNPILLKMLYWHRYERALNGFRHMAHPMIAFAEHLSTLPEQYIDERDREIIIQATIEKLML